MDTTQKPKSSTPLIATAIIWFGALISTAILLLTREEHFGILLTLMSCCTANLIILSYHPKSVAK
jgi:hypothetical protein